MTGGGNEKRGGMKREAGIRSTAPQEDELAPT